MKFTFNKHARSLPVSRIVRCGEKNRGDVYIKKVEVNYIFFCEKKVSFMQNRFCSCRLCITNSNFKRQTSQTLKSVLFTFCSTHFWCSLIAENGDLPVF